jgi:hypothetical protein
LHADNFTVNIDLQLTESQHTHQPPSELLLLSPISFEDSDSLSRSNHPTVLQSTEGSVGS